MGQTPLNMFLVKQVTFNNLCNIQNIMRCPVITAKRQTEDFRLK